MRPWRRGRTMAPAHTGARRPGGRLRRYWDEPAVRAPGVLQRSSRGRADGGECPRSPLPHRLVAHSRRLGQFRTRRTRTLPTTRRIWSPCSERL